MKSGIKLLWFIAVITMIFGFAVTACDDSKNQKSITFDATVRNGGIEVAVDGNAITGGSSARVGRDVRVTSKPAPGYELVAFSVTGEGAAALALTDAVLKASPLTFAMPAGDIAIFATFKLKGDGGVDLGKKLELERNLDFSTDAMVYWGGSNVNQIVSNPAHSAGGRSYKIEGGSNMWNSCYWAIFQQDESVSISADSPHIGRKFIVSAWVYVENMADSWETPSLRLNTGNYLGIVNLIYEDTPQKEWTRIKTSVYSIMRGDNQFTIVVNGGDLLDTEVYFTDIEIWEVED